MRAVRPRVVAPRGQAAEGLSLVQVALLGPPSADSEARGEAVSFTRYQPAGDYGQALRSGRCVYCGAVATVVDHVVPVSKGGSLDLTNLVPACQPCNAAKGASSPAQWLSYLAVQRDGPLPEPEPVEPVRKDNADPVGLVEIAKRLGVERQTAKTWKLRKLLPDAPWIVSGAPAWDWPDIVKWAQATGRWPPKESPA